MPRKADDGGAAIRAFFAVELGEDARRAAAAVAQELRTGPGGDGVRWIRPEAYHVTLRFLGDVDPARIPQLRRCVAEPLASLAPFRLSLGSVRGFPSRRRPRVVVLEVEPAEPLVELAAVLERGVVAAEFPPEDRAFRAHLSLGRARVGRISPVVTSPVTARGEAFDVVEAVLFRSQLGRGGAQYTPLERIALGGSSNHP